MLQKHAGFFDFTVRVRLLFSADKLHRGINDCRGIDLAQMPQGFLWAVLDELIRETQDGGFNIIEVAAGKKLKHSAAKAEAVQLRFSGSYQRGKADLATAKNAHSLIPAQPNNPGGRY